MRSSIESPFDFIIPVFGTVAVLIPFSILGYLIGNGARVVNWAFLTEGPRQFGQAGGIYPTIVASFYVVVLAVAMSSVLSLSAAIYLSEYAPQTRWTELLHLGLNILAGFPSILFGVLGYTLLVVALHLGWSILAGSLTLAFMLIPTIAKITTEAFNAIPKEYQEEALVLGATKWDYITKIGIPLVARAIIAGLVLSVGRATGETAALIWTVGSALKIPSSLLDSARPMSIHILLLAKEGTSLERAFGTSLVLLVIVSLMNVIAIWLLRTRTDVIGVSSG